MATRSPPPGLRVAAFLGPSQPAPWHLLSPTKTMRNQRRSWCVGLAEPASAVRGRRRSNQQTGVEIMRTAILWLLGVPVSVLILLNLTGII